MRFGELEVGDLFTYNDLVDGKIKELEALKINPTINPEFDNFTRWNAKLYNTSEDKYLSIQKYEEVTRL